MQWGVADTVVLTECVSSLPSGGLLSKLTPMNGCHSFPGHMKKQPKNFILVPQMLYKCVSRFVFGAAVTRVRNAHSHLPPQHRSNTRPRDDQFLLLMIAILKGASLGPPPPLFVPLATR